MAQCGKETMSYLTKRLGLMIKHKVMQIKEEQ